MALNFTPLPDTPPSQVIELSNFRGVDFTSDLGEVAAFRSPDCINMVSDQNGRPVKRMGYRKISDIPNGARVNGIFKLVRTDGEHLLIHAGNTLYKWNWLTDEYTGLYAEANDEKGVAFQMGEYLWFADGLKLLRFDGSAVVTAESVADEPITRINADPGGANGVQYHDRNLLSDYAINSFVGDGTSKTFQLNTTRMESAQYMQMSNDGSWPAAWSNVASMDAAKGTVTLSTAPPAPPVRGEDNVRIRFKKTIEGGKDKINKCNLGILWGIGGNNRIVLAGNPDWPNMDFTSELFTALEDGKISFPELNYTLVGSEASKIVGYQRLSSELAVLKEANDQDATVYIRSGVLEMNGDDLEVYLVTKEGIAGVGAISQHCICDLRDDPLFLSEQGVFALEESAVTSTKYAQMRSELINKRLVVEPELREAHMIEYQGYLYLSVGGNVYVADAAQKTDYGRSGEQFQYEWYYWKGIPARVWFKHEGYLWFGTADGRVMRFYNEKGVRTSYNDEGRAIHARWVTPEIAFDSYSLYKTLRRIYTKLKPYNRSGVKIYVKENGGWSLVDERNVDIFNFDDIDFRRFTFNTDKDVGIISTRVKLKRVITTQLRFVNEAWNEPFGIMGITLYYDLKNKVK